MGEAKDGATDRSVAGPHRRLRRRGDGATRRAGAAQDARPFICIEIDSTKEEAIRKLGEGMLYIIGDATTSDVLHRARVEVAHGLVACMPSDKDNLFALMSAHELSPTMRIVTRAVAHDAGPKLLKAGAGAVVSMATIGALRLASAMVRPNVVDLLDAMLREPGATRVQEVTVGPAVVGQALSELKLQERTGVIVFALREGATQRHVFNPSQERVLQAGDVLMGCADTEQHAALQRIVTEG